MNASGSNGRNFMAAKRMKYRHPNNLSGQTKVPATSAAWHVTDVATEVGKVLG